MKCQIHSHRNKIEHSLLTGMKFTIAFCPEWNGLLHSGWNEMDHCILTRMKWTIPFWSESTDSWDILKGTIEFWPRTLAFWPEWYRPLHSGWNGPVHEIFWPNPNVDVDKKSAYRRLNGKLEGNLYLFPLGVYDNFPNNFILGILWVQLLAHCYLQSRVMSKCLPLNQESRHQPPNQLTDRSMIHPTPPPV